MSHLEHRPRLLLLGCLYAWLLVCGGAMAQDAPAIDPLVWKFPHELVWQLDDGPRWYSVGHTATILEVTPGPGKVTLTARAVTGFEADGAPRPGDVLATVDIAAADPAGPQPKSGLHRKRSGVWDFHFGPVPKGPYTFLHRLFFQRSPRFRYCLAVHAAGDLAPDGTFKQLKIAVLVAELLDDPDIPTTLSWPAGQPMPRGIVPTNEWFAKESPRAAWAAAFPVAGPLEAGRPAPGKPIPAFIHDGPGYEIPQMNDKLDLKGEPDDIDLPDDAP